MPISNTYSRGDGAEQGKAKLNQARESTSCTYFSYSAAGTGANDEKLTLRKEVRSPETGPGACSATGPREVIRGKVKYQIRPKVTEEQLWRVESRSAE